MPNLLIGANTVVQVAKTYEVAKTISAITLASTAVVTSTAHGYANGDYVVFNITAGMPKLNGQAGRVANVTANTFEVEGYDSTGQAAFTSGTVQRITAWDTFDNLTAIDAQQSAAGRQEVSTIHDAIKSFVLEQADSPQVTLRGWFDPTAVYYTNCRAASDTNGTRLFLIRFSPGTKKAVMNAYVSAGQGFSMQVNQVASTQITLSLVGNMAFYAT